MITAEMNRDEEVDWHCNANAEAVSSRLTGYHSFWNLKGQLSERVISRTLIARHREYSDPIHS